MKPTAADISNAANKWCGEKDRETFYEDVIYFKHNWQSLPGLRRYVEEAAAIFDPGATEGYTETDVCRDAGGIDER